MTSTTNRNDRGNYRDRAVRRQWLLDTFGDGTTAPCSLRMSRNCHVTVTCQTITVDRYPVPGCQGGRYTRGNIRPACGPCNQVDGGRLGNLRRKAREMNYDMDEATIRTAYQAAARALQVLAGLEQSQRMPDIHQSMAGLRHEVSTVCQALGGALDSVERLTAAATADMPGAVRSDAPVTSRAAARHTAIRTGTQRSNVLMMLATNGETGATDYEIQQTLNLSPSSERPRRGELVSMGLVIPTTRIKIHNGDEWTVWTLTHSGEYVARRIDSGIKTVSMHTIPGLVMSTQDEPVGEPALF